MILLLLASSLVARLLAVTLCHNHPGYATTLDQGRAKRGVLMNSQDRLFCFDATKKPHDRTSSNLYIKLATCKGTVSVKLYDPVGIPIPMKGRDCQNSAERDKTKIRYHHRDTQWDGSAVFSLPEEHTIWTYHNTSARPGTYSIIVTAEQTPCGEAEFQLLASSKSARQPPILPEDTCVYLNNRLTTDTSVGLTWSAAQLPSSNSYQTMKYCVYMIPQGEHNHRCGAHGSRCSVSFMRSTETVEVCFISAKRAKITYVMRNLKPDTEYHVDVIAWTYDRARQIYHLPMAYSLTEYVTTASADS